MSKVTSDGLITERDIDAFKISISRGHLKDQVFEVMNTEPQLALYLGERYGKALRSLQDAGITGRRLAALHRHISLLMWSSAILTAKAHRREWESFLPSEEVAIPIREETIMSQPELPDPFASAKRASGVKVQLQPDDVVAACHDLSLREATRILDDHGSIIAARMLQAGIAAAVKIADGGEA